MSELSEEEIVVKAPYHGARFIIAYKSASLDGMSYPTAEAAQAELDAICAALLQPALERARREERERCLAVVNAQTPDWVKERSGPYWDGYREAMEDASEDIRKG